jgi:hypothetical protein
MNLYLIAKFVSEIPLQILSPLIFGSITYFMVGFTIDLQQILVFMLCLILTTLTGQSLGLVVSVISPSLDIANVISPMLLGMILLCGGLFINVSNMPSWLNWTSAVDFVRYSYQILSVNDLTGLVFECPPPVPVPYDPGMPTPTTQVNVTMATPVVLSTPTPGFFRRIFSPRWGRQPPVDPVPTTIVPNSTVMPPVDPQPAMMQQLCLFPTGEDVLASLSFDQMDMWTCFGILTAMWLVFQVMAYLGLKYIVASKTRK